MPCSSCQPPPGWAVRPCQCRHYTIVNFFFDIVMTIITGGIWLIWIFCREMRRR